MKNIFFFISILLFVSACSKYEIRFEGPYEPSTVGTSAVKFKRDILFVEKGQIKWTDFLLQKTELVKTTTLAKKARANASNTKIAYSDATTGAITIVDSLGNNPQKVPNSDGAQCFFWHFNNQTLCFVNSSSQIKTFGTAVTLIASNISASKVYEMEMLKDGTLISLRLVNGAFYNYNIFVDKPTGSDYTIDLGQYPDPLWLKVGKYANPNIYYGYSWANSSKFGLKSYTFGSQSSPYDYSGERWRIDSPDGAIRATVANGNLLVASYSLAVDEFSLTDLDW